ncbi:MAG: integrase [Holophagaceae bacterium]|nr:integrase [Holophagaceae bacterium]
MAEAIVFIPQAEGEAQDNLRDFIQFAHGILGGYPEIKSWEDAPWDLTGVVSWRGRGNVRARAVFSSHDGAGRGDSDYMAQPFLDFAKAYFLYSNATSSPKTYVVRLAALRALEKALTGTHGTPNVCLATPAIFNIASGHIKERFSAGAGYRVGLALDGIGKFLVNKRLVATPFQWKSPIKRDQDRNRVGPEADRKRADKLPTEAALDALPRCFRNAETEIDILVTSAAALFCCAPERSAEVMTLPADCEVEVERDGKKMYGLRWWGAKGAPPRIKWIIPGMVQVAKEALARLRAVTDKAREIAAWYEANPDHLYLPAEAEHLRGKENLNAGELKLILGVAMQSPEILLQQNTGPLLASPKRLPKAAASFAAVEKMVLSKLPPRFPVFDEATGITYSKALMVVQKNQFHPIKGVYPSMIEAFSTNRMNFHLGSCRERSISLFARFGFKEPDGGPIELTTHQFRHWLNTMAQRGGLSQVDIAKWCDRIDIRQNQAYNHMTSHELVEMTRGITKEDPKLFGPLGELAMRSPLSRDEFMQLEFPTAHTTEIGFCVHDFTMLPCQKHRDCINCSEHVCVKGDARKTQRIMEQLEIAEEQLKRAMEATTDGYFGAGRWAEHHQATIERLRALAQVLNDPSVPVGALIRMVNPNEYSPIRMAIQERHELGDDSIASLALDFGLLKSLAGKE